MLRRQLLRVLGLLVPPLSTASVASARKRGHAGPTGIAVQSASYDPDSGVLTTTVRWHKGELRKDGRNELHIVVFNDGDTPQLLRDRTVTVTASRPTRTHRIALNNKQRREVGDGSGLTVVVTHKHDDDSGLFDRVWHHRLPVYAARKGREGMKHFGVGVGNCGLIKAQANLRGCDLGGANLAGADLTDVDLSSAVMLAANLTGANLSGADFESADITVANLSHTTLTGAKFQDVCTDGHYYDGSGMQTKFSYANMSGMNLVRTTFSQVVMDHANLSNSNMSDARFVWTDLTGADLSGANLTSTELLSANLTGANLSMAIFCNTRMPDGSTDNTNC